MSFLNSDRGVSMPKGPPRQHQTLLMLVVVAVLLALAVAHDVHARVHYALAEDLYAFPKYRVTFLNGLPVLNDTAQRWLAEGLKGGELEFLDQPWNAQMHPPSNLRTIAAQHDDDDDDDDGGDDEHQRPFANPTVRSHSPLLLCPLITFLLD